MATEISVFDSEEFEELISQRDLRISKALVETILKNLKGRKRHLHALTVLVEQDQTIYDITVDRNDFITTLEQNLPVYERNELYEGCAEIVTAVKFLKGKDIKIMYDDPWFWKVSAYREQPKNHAHHRRPAGAAVEKKVVSMTFDSDEDTPKKQKPAHFSPRTPDSSPPRPVKKQLLEPGEISENKTK